MRDIASSPDVTTSSAAQRFDGTRTHGGVGVPLRVEMRVGGADDKVQQAEQELPDQVDPEQHAELLQKLGIDPQDRLGGIGERLGL